MEPAQQPRADLPPALATETAAHKRPSAPANPQVDTLAAQDWKATTKQCAQTNMDTTYLSPFLPKDAGSHPDWTKVAASAMCLRQFPPEGKLRSVSWSRRLLNTTVVAVVYVRKSTLYLFQLHDYSLSEQTICFPKSVARHLPRPWRVSSILLI